MSSPLKIESPQRPQEPSMEEILASIRKIISEDDAKAATPVPARPVVVAKPEVEKPAPLNPAPVEPEPEEAQSQDDIDALMAGFEVEEATPPPPMPVERGVLELTDEMVAPSDEDDGFAALDFLDVSTPEPVEEAAPMVAPPPVVEAARAQEPPPARQPGLEPRPAPRNSSEEHLISGATDSAISAAFGTLTHTILSQNARTLDDLMQDMLRPMLRSWLDDNLPSVVERLVRAEIERVSRGGR